jgi:hypothetical protein
MMPSGGGSSLRTSMTLSAEQLRALRLLAGSSRGMTETLLIDVHGVQAAGHPRPDPRAPRHSRFPLSADDLAKIGRVRSLVRERLPAMTPSRLRSAAALLLALERLPVTTPGIQLTFGFMQRSTTGNYGWADITISEEEFTLHVGEHFYDPSVGGDTESRDLFSAMAGSGDRDGDINGWIRVATVISAEGEIAVDDNCDYETIEWPSDPSDE